MATTPPTSDKWQKLYTAKAAHWDDSKRMGRVLIPFLLLIFFAFVYIFLFIFGNIYRWSDKVGLVGMAGIALVAVPVVMGVMALVYALKVSASFFTMFYRPPDDFDVAGKIRLRLFGIPPLPPLLAKFIDYKYIVLINPDAGIKPEDEWIKWLGGPVQFVIGDGIALYLERGSHFSRVLGPGIAFLERYETVKELVDLRPQNVTEMVQGWTTDGILVKLKVRITFKIGVKFPEEKKEAPKSVKEGKLAAFIRSISIPDRSAQPPDDLQKALAAAGVSWSSPIFPCDPDAVKKAVEKKTVRMVDGKPTENGWNQGGVMGKVSGVVRDYILERSLDELFTGGDSSDSGQILSASERQKMIDGLNRGPMGLENDFGVHMTDLQIIAHEIHDDIVKQRFVMWQAEKQSAAALAEGEIKADQIRTRELARAQSQRDMIMAIARGLENFPYEEEAILLSLSSVLDQSLGDPLKRSYIANEALDTLEKLQKYLKSGEDAGGGNP